MGVVDEERTTYRCPFAFRFPLSALPLVFVALDTRTPYTWDFGDADAGKRVYTMLRWVSTRGDKGPWSETVVATTAA